MQLLRPGHLLAPKQRAVLPFPGSIFRAQTLRTPFEALPAVNKLSHPKTSVCALVADEGTPTDIVLVVEPPPTPVSVSTPAPDNRDIKAALLDSLYGTERGLTARSEVRAEINELISQLESRGSTAPTPEALDGNWKLVYTSNSELMAVLALSKLPFVTVGDVTQKISASTKLVENKVQLSVPFSRTAFSTSATFEVASPKRFQMKLEKGTIQTPELLANLDLPSTVSIMGQALDLSYVKQALQPINDSVSGIFASVSDVISQTPNLEVPIPSEQGQTWQLNTYIDEDTRVTRGDGGSVFVYTKEFSIM